MDKLIAFILLTALYFVSVCFFAMIDKWVIVLFHTLMYITFILVTLYEIGRIEIEREENENRNNRK
jgi:Ca2+/Na+ antiporter